ncbi:MAG: M56 family metallopeptidase [Bacteroidota bacterium]
MTSIIYLLQVCACTAVFYLFYYLFLNRLTFFVTNRWYLLVTVVLSFAIPLIKIPVSQPHVYTGVVEQVVYGYAPKIQIAPQVVQRQTIAQPEPIHWGTFLRLGYLAAVLALTGHLIVTLIAFFKRLKGKRITKIGNVNILSGNKKIANGSFLNYIFLNEEELSADEMRQIIAHEMLHVKLYHSVDRIIVKIAQIILWFNPFIYLYSRSVEENHEFEVDRAVARETDKHNYASLLLHLSVAGQGMLYHNFSKVPLKKRITMLFNQPSANMKKIVYVLIVPVVLISCLAFARLKSNDNKYSVIEGIDKAGKNTAVLIDGKFFSKDILYKISKSCIKAAYITYPGESVDVKGKLYDNGVVVIATNKGHVTYMDDLEKENLAVERSAPQHQLYTRVIQKNADGSVYDKVIVALENGVKASSKISHNGKVAFLVDGKLYNENEFSKLSPQLVTAKSSSLSVGATNAQYFSVLRNMGYQQNLDGYEAAFNFENLQQKLKDAFEVATTAQPRFFKRTHFQHADGADYDKITFTLSNGSSASANLGTTDTAGVFIDGEFYDEAAIIKLNPDITSKLVFDNNRANFNRNKLPKNRNYAVPFMFKTNVTNGTLSDTTITPKYRQKGTPKQMEQREKNRQTFDEYRQTDDYKAKQKLSEDIYKSGLITIKIKDKAVKGFVFTWNGHEYMMDTFYGQMKILNNQLKTGDELQLKVFSSGWRKEDPLVDISPAFIMKNNEKIFQLAEADKIPNYPFLYENNKVRYSDGEVSNIVKYANGVWKSALFETVNGYKFNLSFKPNAPTMHNIA